MKRIKLYLTLLLSLTVFAPLPVVLPGCAYFSPVAEGHDAVVVNAERTAKLAFTLVDTFLEWEYSTRPALSPEVTKAADTIRDEFPKAYTAFRDATKAYKYNRTEENKASLETAMAVIQSAMQSVTKYLPPPEKEKAEKAAAEIKTTPESAL